MSKVDKNSLEANFSRASMTYDSYAKMQKAASLLLLRHVEQARDSFPQGPLLEIGCGTGQMSYGLARMSRSRKLVFTDIAPGMVDICKKRLSGLLKSNNNLSWEILDAEQLAASSVYAAIVSGLTIQWFNDLQGTLKRFYESLLPGGEFIFSCLVNGSFPQWYAICKQEGLPCTANILPEGKENISIASQIFDCVEAKIESIDVDYPSAAYFFKSLKLTGTNTQVDGKLLTAAQMRKLIRCWDNCQNGEKLTITYLIQIIRVKKKL